MTAALGGQSSEISIFYGFQFHSMVSRVDFPELIERKATMFSCKVDCAEKLLKKKKKNPECSTVTNISTQPV